MSEQSPLLEARAIGKSFGGARALDEVGFALDAGRVLGLVGENGAGKSTLINILGGVHAPDRGELRLDGLPFRPRRPADAARAGVAVVHQELNLFPNLNVAENLFLDDLPRFGPGIDRRTLRIRAVQALQVVGLDRDPTIGLDRLAAGERQLVEIARALRSGARVLIFDEPTTSLTRPEAERLFGLIGRMRGQGTAIIYVSHQLDDVRRLADAILILRDGRCQATGPTADFPVATLIRQMVGRELDRLFPPRQSPIGTEFALEVRGFSRVDSPYVDLTIRRGEVLGVAGLMGSGRSELARALFGLEPIRAGSLAIGGRELRPLSPRECARRGMALVTEDRRHDGLLPEASVSENVELAALPRFGGWWGLNRGRLRRAGETVADALGVPPARDREVRRLSGGNQQKAILARWLLNGPDVLLLDEPTRGVDVGARAEIYRLVRGLSARGAAVLWISSELEELIGMCDRIAIMRGGGLVAEALGPAFDREAILRQALGAGEGS